MILQVLQSNDLNYCTLLINYGLLTVVIVSLTGDRVLCAEGKHVLDQLHYLCITMFYSFLFYRVAGTIILD